MECKIDDCKRGTFALGFCRTHYRRHKNGSDMTAPIRTQRNASEVKKCIMKDCFRPSMASQNFCRTCKQRWERTGIWDVPKGHQNWHLDSNGYVIFSPSHQMNPTGKPQLAHRLVMRNLLGRELLPGETVHHKDGNRQNNSLDNLELWSSSQPAGQRVEDKVKWAREILSLYGE